MYKVESRKVYGVDSRQVYEVESRKVCGVGSQQVYGVDGRSVYGLGSQLADGVGSRWVYGLGGRQADVRGYHLTGRRMIRQKDRGGRLSMEVKKSRKRKGSGEAFCGGLAGG